MAAGEFPDSALPAHPPARRGRGLSLRWIGWAAVALIAAGFVWLHRGEWGAMRDAARQADARLLILAALIQSGWLVLFGAMFWGSERAVGVRLPFLRTLAVSWAANFLNMVIKSGGMSGLALFLAAATRRGHAASRATLGYLLTIALGYVEFLVLLAAALVILWLDGELRRYELAASVITFAFLAALIAGAVFVVFSEHRVRRTYGLLARVANALAGLLRRDPWLDPAGGARAAREAHAAALLVRERPARALLPALAGFAKEAAAVAVMYAVLRAFDARPSVPLALAAYALTVLFSYVSILPSGLGLVEVSLTALLIRTGVQPGPAALTTVVYRLYQFWLPFLVGAVATRFLGRGTRPSPPSPLPITGEAGTPQP